MNTSPEIRPAPPLPDIAGAYADRIRELLRSHPQEPLSVPEIVKSLGCKEQRVREGLDRLNFLNELAFGQRYSPGQRGSPPRVYSLR